MSVTFVFAGAAIITAVLQLSGFVIAYALQTEVFYDALGGLNFISVTVFSVYSADGSWSDDPRKVAATLIFVCSRGWLLGFLTWRARERGGDARFDKLKDKFLMFLVAWVTQGMWVMLISLPVLFINSSSTSPPLAFHDTVLLTAFALGVACEMVADVQKARWVRAGRQGGFCTAGLWSYSRHPNYFGEMLQWFGCWLLAYSCAAGPTDPLFWFCGLSPVFTMHVLLNIPATGVAQANGKSLKRYYERFPESYARYRANTSILLPMVGYRFVPMALKRTLFFDLARYEYRPRSSDPGSGGAAPAAVQTSTRVGTRATMRSKENLKAASKGDW